MKFLSVAGTAAMFLVGGGILVHGVPALHHVIEAFGEHAGDWAVVGDVAEVLVPLLANVAVGVTAGAVLLVVVTVAQRVWQRRAAA